MWITIYGSHPNRMCPELFFFFNVSFIVISGRTLCRQYIRLLLSVHMLPEHQSRLSDSEHFYCPVSMGTMGGNMDNSPLSSSADRSVDRTIETYQSIVIKTGSQRWAGAVRIKMGRHGLRERDFEGSILMCRWWW